MFRAANGDGALPQKVSSASPPVLLGDPEELRMSECELTPVPFWQGISVVRI